MLQKNSIQYKYKPLTDDLKKTQSKNMGIAEIEEGLASTELNIIRS
jgi:hypothetical protein